jgi:hypothetical protein
MAQQSVGGGDDDGGGGISWDVEVVSQPADQGADGPSLEADAGASQAAGGAVDVVWEVDVAEAGEGGDGGVCWDVEVSGEVEGGGGSSGGGGGGGGGGVNGGSGGAGDVDWELVGHDVSGGGSGGDSAGGGGDAAAVSRLVADAVYRAALLDDLLELRAFLVQV